MTSGEVFVSHNQRSEYEAKKECYNYIDSLIKENRYD